MSVEAMAVVLHHSRSTGSALAVLVGIANHDGDLGSFPSVLTLAKYGRFNGWDARPVDNTEAARRDARRQNENATRAARRAVRQLETLGEVETIENGGIGGRSEHERTNLYRITLSCPWYCDHSTQHRDLRDERHRKLRPAYWADMVALNDPRTLESGEDSRVRGDRTPESGEPSINHPPIETSSLNDEYQLARERVEASNNPEDRAGRAKSKPSYADWHPGRKVAETAAQVRAARRPAKAAPRSADEQALVDHFQGIECPKGAGLKHWLPPGLTECARGCGLDLTRQPELEPAA